MSTVAKNATENSKNWFTAMRLRSARIAALTQRISSCLAAPITAAALMVVITRHLPAAAAVAAAAPGVPAATAQAVAIRW